ncbi:RNA-splicing ligase RtcB [archaeon]|nr:RNA-splicing ligase RtcB [archaeon]
MEQRTGPPKSIKQVDKQGLVWEVPKSFKKEMRVPARIYANKKILNDMDYGVFDQITNVATLPGIVKYAMCMPDGHYGYGYPIGGVSAFDVEDGGVISPGGIGFDINCGMRLITTNLTLKDVKPKIKTLVDELFKKVPAGVGSKGFLKINQNQFKEVVEEGSKWCVKEGYGWEEDLEKTELDGRADWADNSKISERSIQRGFNQIGTLGSGNHYLEIQHVKRGNIFDEELAKKYGIFEDQIVIMFHCGSRGFGHQVATDYLQQFLKVMGPKYNIKIPDRELACAPFNSDEGQDYYKAMACGVNMSFANRQVIVHRLRETFSSIFNKSPEELEMKQVFDVSHNRASLEKHEVDGKMKKLIVHRKGATGSYYPGREEIPPLYRESGSPVIIGGSMETGSYLLTGSENSKETFCSTCHGSGRTMSRTKAKKMVRGDKLQQDMEKRGIYVKAISFPGLAEEFGGAYKDVDEVIDSVDKAGISKKTVKLIPIGNVKGASNLKYNLYFLLIFVIMFVIFFTIRFSINL